MGAYTGLRLGELLALNWGDIDFKSGTVSVTKNVITVEDFDNETDKKNVTKIQDSPKTRASIRKVPLSETVTQVLKAHRQDSNNIWCFAPRAETSSIRVMSEEVFTEYLKMPELRSAVFIHSGILLLQDFLKRVCLQK